MIGSTRNSHETGLGYRVYPSEMCPERAVNESTPLAAPQGFGGWHIPNFPDTMHTPVGDVSTGFPVSTAGLDP